MKCQYCGSEISENEKCPCRADGSWIKLVLIIVACFLGVTILLLFSTTFFMGGARESGRRASCTNNLKQLGNALEFYQASNNSYRPNGTLVNGKVVTRDKHGAENAMEILRSLEYLTDHKVYVCPSSDYFPGEGNEQLTYNDNLSYGYAYVSDNDYRHALSGDLTGDNINSGDANHDEFGNLLYADGHVKGFASKRWHTPEKTGNICIYPNEFD